MRKLPTFLAPVVALSLAGCADNSNPPAQVAALTQEQIKAEEKHQESVSDLEKKHEESLGKAAYIPHEEAVIAEAERAHEDALRDRRRSKSGSQPRQ